MYLTLVPKSPIQRHVNAVEKVVNNTPHSASNISICACLLSSALLFFITHSICSDACYLLAYCVWIQNITPSPSLLAGGTMGRF